MIQLDGVTKSFGRLAPVRNLSLAISPGECVALVGPSGAGKSTLLRLIAGFEVPDAGTVRLGGRVVSGPGILVPPQDRGVAMVFQGLALWPHMSVRRHLDFVLHGLSRAARECRRVDLIRRFEIGHRAGAFPSELSGGEQQRLAIARGIAVPAPVLLLDEPFRNLDEGLKDRVVSILADHLARTGATLLTATQQPSALSALAPRTLRMENGAIVQEGAS